MVKYVRLNSTDLLPCAIVERYARQVRVEAGHELWIEDGIISRNL